MLRNNEWVTPSELTKREFNKLRGKACSLIEAMNLSEDQTKNAIALLKQMTYESQERMAQLLNHADRGARYRYSNDLIEVRDYED